MKIWIKFEKEIHIHAQIYWSPKFPAGIHASISVLFTCYVSLISTVVKSELTLGLWLLTQCKWNFARKKSIILVIKSKIVELLSSI